MRFGPANFGCGACAVLFVVGCGAWAPELRAQGLQRSTRSAASSETNSVEIFSTLKGLDEKDDGLKRLDEELTKSLQPFINREPVPSPVGSTYQAPRLPVAKKLLSKEELEKSRGWVWDTEEAMSGRSEEEKSMFPGFSSNTGSDKKRSAWDQYSKNPRPQPLSSSDYQSREEPEAKSKSDSDDGADFSGGIGTAAKRLKARLETESVGSIFRPSAHGSVADFFGQPSVAPPTAAQIQAHKDYMDEYQKIIGGSVFDSQNPELQTRTSLMLPGNSAGLDTLPSSSRNDGVAVNSGLVPSAPTAATVSDANANILNQWNPLYSPPKIELPKPAPFFPAPMEFPRRKF